MCIFYTLWNSKNEPKTRLISVCVGMYNPSETQSPFSNYRWNSVHYMLILAKYSQQDRKCFSKGLLPIIRFVGLFVCFRGLFFLGFGFLLVVVCFVFVLFKRLFHLTGQNLRVFFFNLTSRHHTPVKSMGREGLPENISWVLGMSWSPKEWELIF